MTADLNATSVATLSGAQSAASVGWDVEWYTAPIVGLLCGRAADEGA
jgi:hypothetical protein